MARVAFVIKETARISELDQVVDENAPILAVIGEDIKCMTKLSR